MAIPVPAELKPRGSVLSAPPRRAGSVRRTTTMDFTWPDGLTGDTVLDGRGRDLRTNGDGTAAALAEASLEMLTDPRRIIKEIGSAPELPELQSLAGESAMSGYRRRLAATGAAAPLGGTPLYQLLDDIPGATLVSGAADQTLRLVGAGDVHALAEKQTDRFEAAALSAELFVLDVRQQPLPEVGALGEHRHQLEVMAAKWHKKPFRG